MTPTQLKEAIDKEIDSCKLINPITNELSPNRITQFAYRIAALTAEAMVGDKQQYGSGTWSYYERIAEERQLADEIKKLSE